MKSASHPERGSAMLYIILGIMLIATLSYLVTKGFRFSDSSLTKDQSAMAAQDIMFYGDSVAKGVEKLRLRGCTENQLDFSNGGISRRKDGVAYVYTNGNAPGDGSCSVFTPGAGGVNPLLLTSGYVDPALVPDTVLDPRSFIVLPVRVLGIGTDANAPASGDLVIWIVRLTKETCMRINDILGIPNPGGNPPVDVFASILTFIGVYGAVANPIGDEASVLVGRTAYCVAYNTDGLNYMFHRVLVAR